MKKRTKIVISVLFIVILLVSISLNIILGIKTGIIKEVKTLSGTVNEAWKKTDTNIAIGDLITDKMYSSEGDDCIYNLYFLMEKNDIDYCIAYDTDFNIADDLEVYFVIKNNLGQTYTTPIQKSHSPVGGDSIFFTLYQNLFDRGGLRIKEVWVRTID